MAENIFAAGMNYKEPRDTAPEWIKGEFSFKADKFIEFLQKHKNKRGYVNVDWKTGKNGNDYFSLNTWEPTRPVEDKGFTPSASNPPSSIIHDDGFVEPPF